MLCQMSIGSHGISSTWTSNVEGATRLSVITNQKGKTKK